MSVKILLLKNQNEKFYCIKYACYNQCASTNVAMKYCTKDFIFSFFYGGHFFIK